ncbi:agmatinase family protein [Bacillus cereus group sp. MYBKT14-1]|uniref:agmatinase family protein n=1 Tax=unclassified Bacillus cereus group TaxID=2750818 RepID=UPI003F26BC72
MDIHKLKVVNDSSVKWIADNWESLDNLSKNNEMTKFSFLSFPFDYAVSHRPGTRFGPQSILDVLNSYSLYCADKRVSLDKSVFYNLGSVDIVHDLQQSYKNMEEAVSNIEQGHIPIFLGGDHSIADPIIRGMYNRLGNDSFGVIIFDTHFDFRDPLKGKEHSGHWLKTLQDKIDYNNVAIIGIGAPIYSNYYMEELESRGAKIWTLYDLRRMGREKVIEEAINHVTKSTEGVYLSVDVDSMDQAFISGCSVPNPNGLYPFEVIDSIYEIALKSKVVGIDINEVSPWYDHQQNYTPHVAANIILNFMAGVIKSHL